MHADIYPYSVHAMQLMVHDRERDICVVPFHSKRAMSQFKMAQASQTIAIYSPHILYARMHSLAGFHLHMPIQRSQNALIHAQSHMHT